MESFTAIFPEGDAPSASYIFTSPSALISVVMNTTGVPSEDTSGCAVPSDAGCEGALAGRLEPAEILPDNAGDSLDAHPARAPTHSSVKHRKITSFISDLPNPIMVYRKHFCA